MVQLVRIRRRGGLVVQDCDVYIGRACHMGGWSLSQSPWYNPFSARQYGREECIRLYREHLLADGNLLARLPELMYQTLGCWCSPEPCHGDVLVEMVRELEEEEEAMWSGVD